MTPSEARFWRRVQRRVAQMRPDLVAAVERAWRTLKDNAPSDAVLARLIREQDVEGLVNALVSQANATNAMGPARDVIRDGVRRAAVATEAAMPSAVRASVGVRFDLLNPRVVDAITELEGASLSRMVDDTREAVRQAVRRGIEDGVNPNESARGIRDVLGLTPKQEEFIANYRRELQDGKTGAALGRRLRDKRFDARTQAGNLTAAQIEQQVAAYRRKFVNYNASLNARTIAAESQRIGQREAWRQMIADGTDGAVVLKRWVHSGVPVEPRPEHLALDGVEVPFNEPYPNGDSYPGEGDPWNCRCVEVYRVVAPAMANV